MICPNGTVSSEDKTYCMLQQHILRKNPIDQSTAPLKGHPLLFHSAFFSSNLNSNLINHESSANYSICKTEGAYCQHNFFGPVY